jgi:hypothetical protein
VIAVHRLNRTPSSLAATLPRHQSSQPPSLPPSRPLQSVAQHVPEILPTCPRGFLAHTNGMVHVLTTAVPTTAGGAPMRAQTSPPSPLAFFHAR